MLLVPLLLCQLQVGEVSESVGSEAVGQAYDLMIASVPLLGEVQDFDGEMV